MLLQIGKQNPYTYVFNPSNGTLQIKGLLNYVITAPSSINLGALVSIYDVTLGQYLSLTSVTVTKTLDAATQTHIFTVNWLPGTLQSGLNAGDTLIITVNATYEWIVLSLLQYQKA